MNREQEQRAAHVMMLRSRGVRDIRVLNAFERMPRRHFLVEKLVPVADRDSPLPLPCGQTMERPSHAARLIETMRVQDHHHVLEIGAGSGWLTGVLAQLAARVTAFERYSKLARQAGDVLHELGIANADVIHGDGMGAQPSKTFDIIFLNASFESLPTGLTKSLKEGGRLFAAIGRAEAIQQFTCFSKSMKDIKAETLFPVRFTPLEVGTSLAL